MAANNVSVSESILEAMRREAKTSGKDVDRLFEEAAEKLLAHRELDDLAAYGKANTIRIGLKPSDSVRFIREDRIGQQRGQ